MSKILRILLVFLVSISIFSFSHKASASTYITEDIITDTNWGISESPYLIQNSIVILPNTTLTIDPGVVVKFTPFTNSSIVVLGKFLAHGTENQKIYFTSGYDDEFYSNTDDEEFCYDEFDAEGNITGGQVCEVYDLGEPFPGDWNGFYFDHSSNSVLQNVIFKYATDALFLYSSSVNFKNLNIEKSESGLTVFDHSVVDLLGGDLSDLDKDAISLFGNSSLTLKDVTVSNIHDDPISIFNTSTLNASNLTIQNLPQFDFPFTDVLALFNGSTLSIKNSDFKYCPGEACITFFNGSSYLTTPVDLSVEDTKFSGGTGSAFLTFGKGESVTNIKNSIIKDFTNYGVENYSTVTVNAENNDWGDKTGPKHSTLNPDGLGQVLYGNVDFEPWVGQEGPIPETFYAKIKDAPGGVAKMYLGPDTTELVKTFPNDWILKVFYKTLTPDGWIKVQDMTDESYGWMNLVFEYEESKQAEFEENSSDNLSSGNKLSERRSVLLKALNHYYNNTITSHSLYSSNDTASISKLKKNDISLEVILAIIAGESGGGPKSGFSNEIVTKDYGHGIMQITTDAYAHEDPKSKYFGYVNNMSDPLGNYSNVKLKVCEVKGSNQYKKCYENTENYNSKSKPYSHYDHNVANQKYKQYANTVQSIYSNIKDGLGILVNKYNSAVNTTFNVKAPCVEGKYHFEGYDFSCNDILKVKMVWFYNGKSYATNKAGKPNKNDTNYLKLISGHLKDLNNSFPGYEYENSDHLIEKLAIANKHRIEIQPRSPVFVAIKDSVGSVVGDVNAKEIVDIPTGAYDMEGERIVIFFPDDNYTYEVVGDSEGGTYGLDIDIFDDSEEPVSFRAIDLPIIPGEKHIYKVDEEKLKNNESNAVTVIIDKDGDGIPERVIYSNNELLSLDIPNVLLPKAIEAPAGSVPLWILNNSFKPLVLGAQTEKIEEELQKIKPIENKITPKKLVKKSVIKKKGATQKEKTEITEQKQESNKPTLPVTINKKKANWLIRLWQLLF